MFLLFFFLFFFLIQDVDVVGNDILSMVYYFFNLMPLSRGSRYRQKSLCIFLKEEIILVKSPCHGVNVGTGDL